MGGSGTGGEVRQALRHLVREVRSRGWRAPPAEPMPAPRPPSILLLKTPPWDTRLPPLGIGYLASYLAAHGLDARPWDCNIDTFLRFRMDRGDLWDMESSVFWFTPDKVAEVFDHEADVVARRIVQEDTDWVGLSLTMEGICFARLVSDRLRRDAPEKVIVAGGPAAAFPETRALFPRGCVDLFVAGPGEEALRLVMAHRIGRGGSHEGTLPCTLRLWRDRPHDPDCPVCLAHPIGPADVEHPTFDGYDLCKYLGRDHLALMMGLGCSGACAFCADRPDQGAYRPLDFEKLMRAVALYKERYWVGGITWNDLVLGGDPDHLQRFCQVLTDNAVELVWDGQAAARRKLNEVPFIFQKMARAGCTDLTWGIESLSDRVLGLMHKGTTEAIATESLRLCKEAGIATGINLICGFPGETEQDFQDGLAALERHRDLIDRVTSLSICAVMPGSALFSQPDRFGITLPPAGHYHEWQTVDGSNTLPLRIERHARLCERVRELGLQAVVQSTREFDPRLRP